MAVTTAQFNTYKTATDAKLADLQNQINLLKNRVTALESAAPAPTPTPTTTVYDNFPADYNLNTNGQLSPNGKWQLAYTGYNPSNPDNDRGVSGVAALSSAIPGTQYTRMFFAYPYSGVNTGGTNATLTISTAEFADFDHTVYMRTIKGMRSPTPKNWEVAWLLFRFNLAGFTIADRGAHFHHYYFLIHRDGHLEFGRKDNTQEWEEQTFLSTDQFVTYADGRWYKVRIKAVGFHIQIWIDDVLKIDMIDDGTIGTRKKLDRTTGVTSTIPVEPPSDFMKKGRWCHYAEDAHGQWGPTVTA
jgi:hypothetical protein